MRKKECFIEGIYTHIYNAQNEDDYQKQIDRFKMMLDNVENIEEIPIIHVPASEALAMYPKPDFVNGCRPGIIMYGFSADKNLHLESTFRLYSEVIKINFLKKGETVGYNGTFKALEDTRIAVVSIGFADGIIRKNKGRYVYIHDKKYEIVRKYLYGHVICKSR